MLICSDKSVLVLVSAFSFIIQVLSIIVEDFWAFFDGKYYLTNTSFLFQIFHILHVEANSILSYRVREEHTIRDVQVAIESEIMIPISKQIIMQAKGLYLESTQSAFTGCADEVNFLFINKHARFSLLHPMKKTSHILCPVKN